MISKMYIRIIIGLLLVPKFYKSRTNNIFISACIILFFILKKTFPISSLNNYYLLHQNNRSPSRTVSNHPISSLFMMKREGNCAEIRGARTRRLLCRGEGVQSRDKRSHEGGKTQGDGGTGRKSRGSSFD